MTGAFLKVKRDGKFKNIEVEYLTEDELNEIFGSKSHVEIMGWLSMTCSMLRLADEAISRQEKMIKQTLSKSEDNAVDG